MKPRKFYWKLIRRILAQKNSWKTISETSHPPPLGKSRALDDIRFLLKILLPYAAPQTAPLLLTFALTLLLSVLGAMEPLVLKYTVDGLTQADPEKTLLVGVTALLALCLLRHVLVGLSSYNVWKVRLAVDFNLRRELMDHLQKHSVSFHLNCTPTARLMRLNKGVDSLIGAFSDTAFGLFPQVVFLVVSLSIMLRLEWRLTLIAMVLAPLPVWIGAMAAEEQTSRERKLHQHWTSLYSRLGEVFGTMGTVKCFARESAEKRRCLKATRHGNRIILRGVNTDAVVMATRALIVDVAKLSPLAYGGWLIIIEQMTIGTLLAFTAYIGGIFSPVQSLTGVYQTLRRAKVGYEQIEDILTPAYQVPDFPDAVICPPVQGYVTFEHVSFSYTAPHPVLEDISLQAAPGDIVAVVGPNGSGKTTLLDLLLRLQDPDAGAVKVDGVDIRKYKQRTFRRWIGVVRHDTSLFNDTIAANIAYGNPMASREEVVQAAVLANAHEFILQLPKGYDTVVGENQVVLSAGQRQRVAIARALLLNPKLLVLDEATSALDIDSEAGLQQVLEMNRHHRTTFIVAHRLTTVVRATKILVLQHGKIVEAGKHEDLVRLKGLYAAMLQKQTSGLITPSQPFAEKVVAS